MTVDRMSSQQTSMTDHKGSERLLAANRCSRNGRCLTLPEVQNLQLTVICHLVVVKALDTYNAHRRIYEAPKHIARCKVQCCTSKRKPVRPTRGNAA